jgi:hypothetical protein
MKDNWISVKDRLPEKGQEVLIFDKYTDTVNYCWYNEGIWDCGCYCEIYYNHVTHWQPIPAPPKDGNK